VAWLLNTYAPESAVDAKQREISHLSRQPGESVSDFSSRLQFEAALLGDLINDRGLRTHFYSGLDEATSLLARSMLTSGWMVTQTFQEAVAHAARVDQGVTLLNPAHRASRPQASISKPRITPGRGILAIPQSYSTNEEKPAADGSYDVDLGVFAVRGEADQKKDLSQYYCYTCWRQGHFASDCPLIPDEERKAIAARKAAVMGMMKNRPGWFDRAGRHVPNVPYGEHSRSTSETTKNV
jgi:hypothetical protein